MNRAIQRYCRRALSVSCETFYQFILDLIRQGFSTCGQRGASKGSAGNPRKTRDPSHIN